MKLRSKIGETKFFLLDPATKEVWSLNSLTYLTLRQQQKMDGHPDLILQFAHYILAQQIQRSSRREEAHFRIGNRSEPPHVGCYPPAEVARLMVKAARAVHHAHQHGILQPLVKQ